MGIQEEYFCLIVESIFGKFPNNKVNKKPMPRTSEDYASTENHRKKRINELAAI
jgi:hypothetical protein